MNSLLSLSKPVVLISLISFLTACGGGGGSSSNADIPVNIQGNPSNVYLSASLPPGGQCPAGGVTVASGIDDNANGILDTNEIDLQQIICNGETGTDGANGLIQTAIINAGGTCANGGLQIDTGADTDGDGVLRNAEISKTDFLCNGVNGTNGSNGINGTNGASGTDGLNSLVTINPELAGLNCANGGTRIDVGLDANQNLILDPAEIDNTQYVCGAAPSLIADLIYIADPRRAGSKEVYAAATDGSGSALLFAPRVDVSKTVLGFNDFQLSPDHKWVSFISSGQLFIANLDSLALPRQLTIDSEVTSSYTWAPDSSFLVVVTKSGTGAGFADTMYSVFTDGTGVFALNAGITAIGSGQLATFGKPQFSPDGSQFVVMMKDEHVTQLRAPYIFDATTFSFHTIANFFDPTVADVSDVQWAPDGSRLAYIGRPSNSNPWQLFTVEPSGLNGQQVSGVYPSGGDVLSFKWSSGGSLIAFLSDKNTLGVNELFTVTANGAASFTVSGAMVANGDVLKYQWSPNGNNLAYLADAATDTVDELYAVSSVGVGRVKISGSLTTGGDVLDYQWSPDSSRVAFRADLSLNRVNELYTVVPNPLSTPVPVKVSGNTGLISSPPSDRGVIDYQWAPDGSKLAFRGDIGTAGVHELYVAQPTGGIPVNVSSPPITGSDVKTFSWASDSTRLVMMADLLTDNMDEVFVVGANGTGRTPISVALPAGSTVSSFFLQ